jgi:acyl carrier protein
MVEDRRIEHGIRHLLVSVWPECFCERELRGETPLGDEGLELDSVEIAEFVIACADRFGVTIGDDLFTRLPSTIGVLGAYFATR